MVVHRRRWTCKAKRGRMACKREERVENEPIVRIIGVLLLFISTTSLMALTCSSRKVLRLG